ncbi:hypothetical protein V9T40_009810 [Parthenolecanium corni]|uniref:Uncharacterized protein n=1 Tax=Parthenolecanium corni TaxID=536013 RepID=A0AAN9Y2P8_9HEMI
MAVLSWWSDLSGGFLAARGLACGVVARSPPGSVVRGVLGVGGRVGGVVRSAVTGEPVSPNAVGRRPRRVCRRRGGSSSRARGRRRVSARRRSCVRAAGRSVGARDAGGRSPLIGLPPADKA